MKFWNNRKRNFNKKRSKLKNKEENLKLNENKRGKKMNYRHWISSGKYNK